MLSRQASPQRAMPTASSKSILVAIFPAIILSTIFTMILNYSNWASLEFRCPWALRSSRLHLSLGTLYCRHGMVLIFKLLLLRWWILVVMLAWVIVIALAALLCDGEFLQGFLSLLLLLLRCIIHIHIVLIVLTLFWKRAVMATC